MTRSPFEKPISSLTLGEAMQAAAAIVLPLLAGVALVAAALGLGWFLAATF